MTFRISAPPLPTYKLSLLREEAFAAFPNLLDVNELDDGAEIAFYFPTEADAPTRPELRAVLSAHDGTQETATEAAERLREEARIRLAAVDRATLDPALRDVMEALGL